MVFLNETLGHTLYMGVYLFLYNNENCIVTTMKTTKILKIIKITMLLAQMTTSFYSNPLMSVTLLSALRALTIIK